MCLIYGRKLRVILIYCCEVSSRFSSLRTRARAHTHAPPLTGSSNISPIRYSVNIIKTDDVPVYKGVIMTDVRQEIKMNSLCVVPSFAASYKNRV